MNVNVGEQFGRGKKILIEILEKYTDVFNIVFIDESDPINFA